MMSFAKIGPVTQTYDSIQRAAGERSEGLSLKHPMDFNHFREVVRQQIQGLQTNYSNLKKRFGSTCSDIDSEIQRIEEMTDHLQGIFNDFVSCFNNFVEREARLGELHQQAIKKSQELRKKMQLEILAQSSQRGQLLAIVDDLGG